MKLLVSVVLAMATVFSATAQKFSYTFNNTPISEALAKFSRDHKDVSVAFLYKELDNYKTSARVRTDNPYAALRSIVGANPISVVEHKGGYYVEALQRGKYRYSGKLVGTDNQPVVAATVMLLDPKDSVVLTYGLTDAAGNFSIPCDSRGVVGKLSSTGYSPKVMPFRSFSVGTIIMTEEVVNLKELNVQAESTYLYSDRTVYIPTSRQKNASQTAVELLNRMAIPQLALGGGNSVTTASGAGVAIFIDYLLASKEDLVGMRTADVKKVEFYEHPSDPRFRGSAYVVNFIMQQYEYGGYVKVYGEYDYYAGRGELPLFAKLKYKKMTYDLGVGWSESDSKHDYSETQETFRLPQPEGGEETIVRTSTVDESRNRNRTNWSTLRATYASDNLTMRNSLGVNFDHSPRQDWSGKIDYSVYGRFPSSEFSRTGYDRVNSFSYQGDWNYNANSLNTFSLSPYYVYSHSNTMSDYTESGAGSYLNMAKDNSHQFILRAYFRHSFGEAGVLSALFQSRITASHTDYRGTTDFNDWAETYRVGPGVNYFFQRRKFNMEAGVGFTWDKVKYQSLRDCQIAPWADFFFRYTPTSKHSLSFEFHHAAWPPSSSYRSANIVQIDPLMSYTGNPALAPYRSFDPNFSYFFKPTSKFSMSVYAGGWWIDNPYVFNYEAGPGGILRTVIQPAGGFSNWNFSVRPTLRLLSNNLIFSGQFGANLAHHGFPYDLTKTSVHFTLSGQYYVGNWNFEAFYASKRGSSTDSKDGVYVRSKDSYYLRIGWANSDWNFQATISDLFRWNWQGSEDTMHSRYYDFEKHNFSSLAHCRIKFSATYTFGFGKKVERGNEVGQTYGADSGILK